MSLQALRHDTTAANLTQVPLQAASIVLAAKAPRFGQSIGAGAAVLGGINLVQSFTKRDSLTLSHVGSAAQTVGGLTMFVARNPVTMTRGATAVIAGSLLNLIDQHVAPEHRAEAIGLKGAVIAGAAGAISVGRHGISPAGLVTVGVIAGMASWLTAECMADNSGPRGTSPEMVRMAIGLRSRH